MQLRHGAFERVDLFEESRTSARPSLRDEAGQRVDGFLSRPRELELALGLGELALERASSPD